MFEKINFPKQNVEAYYDSYEFEVSLLEHILSGNIVASEELYCQFFESDYCLDPTDSDIPSLKKYIISLSSTICFSTIKKGVSPYTAKATHRNILHLVDNCFDRDSVIGIGRSMILGFCAQTVTNNTEFSSDKPCIRKALNYINDNLGEQLSLEEVATHVHLSRDYFCSCFKREVGLGFKEYLNLTRIEKSKFFLCHSDKSILDVATLFGFASQSYFTLVFKKYTGLTPNRFRREHKRYMSLDKSAFPPKK